MLQKRVHRTWCSKLKHDCQHHHLTHLQMVAVVHKATAHSCHNSSHGVRIDITKYIPRHRKIVQNYHVVIATLEIVVETAALLALHYLYDTENKGAMHLISDYECDTRVPQSELDAPIFSSALMRLETAAPGAIASPPVEMETHHS